MKIKIKKIKLFLKSNWVKKRPPPCEGFRSEGVKQAGGGDEMGMAGSELLCPQLSRHVVLLGFGRKVGCA